jgi:hypothetical protein
MKVSKPSELPDEYGCNLCGQTKAVDDMVVVHQRKEKIYYLRPRCKDCHNAKERGSRREWKRDYLRKWRKDNRAVNKSYYQDNPHAREQYRGYAAKYFNKNHDALLIQGRLLRAVKMRVTVGEARALLEQFGPAYPSQHGLTPQGLKECKRIRGAMARKPGRRRFSAVQIRMMVYEDGYFIDPLLQERPYQKRAERMRNLRASQLSEVRKAA